MAVLGVYLGFCPGAGIGFIMSQKSVIAMSDFDVSGAYLTQMIKLINLIW